MQVIVVQNPQKGIERAKEELYKLVDSKTVLFLSGGNTPKPLYEVLAEEGIIKPVAVALVDERFGPKMHETSNEKMIAETKLLKYFSALNIPFHPILFSRHPELGTNRVNRLYLDSGSHEIADQVRNDELREETAEKYDEIVRSLFFHFPKSVGVMGIGADGHTSSIIPNRKDFENPMFAKENRHKFVGEFNDKKSSYKERIGLTFAGIALLDFYIVLAFGKDKAKAIQKAFEPGPLEEIPARFFLSDSSSKKTLFITDQKI